MTLLKLTIARDRLQHVLLALHGPHCTSLMYRVPREIKSLYWGQRSEPVSYVVRRSRYTSKAQQVPQLTNSKRYCLSLRNKLQHISPTSHSHHCTSARVPMIRRSEKKKKKLTCPPKAKSGHNGLPEGYGGTQAKHSSFYRRSMTSAITCCQAIWRFCLISDMNTSQFKSRFNHVPLNKKNKMFPLPTCHNGFGTRMKRNRLWLVNISDTNQNAAFFSKE